MYIDLSINLFSIQVSFCYIYSIPAVFFFFLVYSRVMNSASNYVAVENCQEMNDNSRD